MPVGATLFSEALRMGTEVFHYLKAELKLKDTLQMLGMKEVLRPI